VNEEERIQVLEEYEILDTLAEKEFDDIVELASAFFHTPISLISLLDSHRQWFKARVGLAAQETPIEQAFCYHAIKNPDQVMVVPDSFMDDRFKDNPLSVGDPHVRFYAGAPLVTETGYALGTLCVIDNQPRSFSEEQERVLRILAMKVIERIDNRKKNIEAKKQVEMARLDKEQYTAALEETLFTLSHKIRRPVANVIGMVNELIKADLKEEERKEYVPYLKTSAEELDIYIRELNDFIHQKKIKLNKTDQD
jgi:GAF domain-containing protein